MLEKLIRFHKCLIYLGLMQAHKSSGIYIYPSFSLTVLFSNDLWCLRNQVFLVCCCHYSSDYSFVINYFYMVLFQLIFLLCILIGMPFTVDDYSEIKPKMEQMVDSLIKHLLQWKSPSPVQLSMLVPISMQIYVMIALHPCPILLH